MCEISISIIHVCNIRICLTCKTMLRRRVEIVYFLFLLYYSEENTENRIDLVVTIFLFSA